MRDFRRFTGHPWTVVLVTAMPCIASYFRDGARISAYQICSQVFIWCSALYFAFLIKFFLSLGVLCFIQRLSMRRQGKARYSLSIFKYLCIVKTFKVGRRLVKILSHPASQLQSRGVTIPQWPSVASLSLLPPHCPGRREDTVGLLHLVLTSF